MSAEAKAVFGQVVFDDPKGFGAHAVEFGQFRAWDARELTQGCVARVVQGAGRRCADLGQLIEGCRHAERLGQRYRTQPGDGRLDPRVLTDAVGQGHRTRCLRGPP